MRFFTIKRLIIAAIICLAAIAVAIFALLFPQKEKEIETPTAPAQEIETPAKITEPEKTHYEIIGNSVQNRPIEAYTFGIGGKLLVFVGAIHGGYEWNTALLANQAIDYFKKNPESIPKNLSVAIIPALNPDGLFKIIGKEGIFTVADIPAGNNDAGRFNANNVDLNRNFDCNWQAAKRSERGHRSLFRTGKRGDSRLCPAKQSGGGCVLAQPIQRSLWFNVQRRYAGKNSRNPQCLCRRFRLSGG